MCGRHLRKLQSPFNEGDALIVHQINIKTSIRFFKSVHECDLDLHHIKKKLDQ